LQHSTADRVCCLGLLAPGSASRVIKICVYTGVPGYRWTTRRILMQLLRHATTDRRDARSHPGYNPLQGFRYGEAQNPGPLTQEAICRTCGDTGAQASNEPTVSDGYYTCDNCGAAICKRCIEAAHHERTYRGIAAIIGDEVLNHRDDQEPHELDNFVKRKLCRECKTKPAIMRALVARIPVPNVCQLCTRRSNAIFEPNLPATSSALVRCWRCSRLLCTLHIEWSQVGHDEGRCWRPRCDPTVFNCQSLINRQVGPGFTTDNFDDGRARVERMYMTNEDTRNHQIVGDMSVDQATCRFCGTNGS
jgi:hypothetical protein